MYADTTRQRPVLIAAALLFWAAWIGAFGILPTGELSGAHAGAPTQERLRGPVPSPSDAYALATLPTVVPSAARAIALRGQSPGGGQGTLSTALRSEGTAFPVGLGHRSAFHGWDAGRSPSVHRSPEHLPRPPPVLFEAG